MIAGVIRRFCWSHLGLLEHQQSSGVLIGVLGDGGTSKVTSVLCLESWCRLLPMINDLQNLSSFSIWFQVSLNSRDIFQDYVEKAKVVLSIRCWNSYKRTFITLHWSKQVKRGTSFKEWGNRFYYLMEEAAKYLWSYLKCYNLFSGYVYLHCSIRKICLSLPQNSSVRVFIPVLAQYIGHVPEVSIEQLDFM